MSSDGIESGRMEAGEAAGEEAGEWKTGPGKPPIEYRFRKGQSGNPAGRPRRTGAPGDRLIGADEPTMQLILDEAYCRVTVREDGRETEMPMNRAVIRAIGRAALNGSPSAQRRWAVMVREAEAMAKRKQLAIYRVTEHSDRQAEERYRKYRQSEAEAAKEAYDPYAEDVIFDPRIDEVVVRVQGEDEV